MKTRLLCCDVMLRHSLVQCVHVTVISVNVKRWRSSVCLTLASCHLTPCHTSELLSAPPTSPSTTRSHTVTPGHHNRLTSDIQSRSQDTRTRTSPSTTRSHTVTPGHHTYITDSHQTYRQGLKTQGQGLGLQRRVLIL